MSEIETIYVVNHSHTDIGYTDFQDICFQQHGEFVREALDLIEATADYPAAARYRWTCEVTAPLVRWLRGAPEPDRARFRHWVNEGAVEVAGMQYNLTPLLGVEQLCRSLYPLRELREEYGVEVKAAMQCDVNGVAWLFADLLPGVGIEILTMAINEIRGRAPRPRPGAFWWEGPAGGRVLCWNGFHYSFGRSVARLGDWRLVERALPPILQRLEGDPDYPFDFLYCQATHPLRADNGPPDARLPEFVRRWNDEGRTPRIVITTPREVGRLLGGRELPVRRGDWTDWWCDGVASTAYETGLNRRTQELLGAAEVLAAWLQAEGYDGSGAGRWDRLYEVVTLFDEHTWGGFSSIATPDVEFVRAQWSRKASYAHEAALGVHDALARVGRSFAETRGEAAPEGTLTLGRLAAEEAYPPGPDELLVINTLPWARRLLVDEPELRRGAPPVGTLEGQLSGGRSWDWALARPAPRRASAELSGFGYAFVRLHEIQADDLGAGDHWIENAHYRVEVDPDTGGLRSLLDKELGADLAGEHRGWRLGQLVYERVESPEARDALFRIDFTRDGFGSWVQNPPLRHESARAVRALPSSVEQGVASIDVDVELPGLRGARCRYWLETERKVVAMDWLLDKEHVTEPESVYVAFPFALAAASFRLDLNGVPCTPDVDQLPGGVRDWYPVRRWLDLSDGQAGATIAPLDAPLVQLGGITTGRIADELGERKPIAMSWALNNHWMTNFKASQGGRIPLRYRLTTHRGPCDDQAAERFAADVAVQPVVLRDYERRGEAAGRFLEVPEGAAVEVTAKPAEDGDGIIVRLRSLGSDPRDVPLRFVGLRPRSAHRVSPIEDDEESLRVDGESVHVRVATRALESVRVRFATG
jgi:alpha-mannosidase